MARRRYLDEFICNGDILMRAALESDSVDLPLPLGRPPTGFEMLMGEAMLTLKLRGPWHEKVLTLFFHAHDEHAQNAGQAFCAYYERGSSNQPVMDFCRKII